MASAIVRAKAHDGGFIASRILLDSCSTVNLVTEQFVKLLKIPTTSCSVSIGAIDNMYTHATRYAEISFHSIHNDFNKTLKFLIVPKITDRVPNETFPRSRLKIPPNVKLADPQFHIPRPVEMLIGAGTTLALMSVRQIHLDDSSDIVLQKTQLGWIIAGGFIDSKDKQQSCNLTKIDNLLENFWKIEDLDSISAFSAEEIACDNHYVKHTTRDASGRYIVKLPFRTNDPILGDSRTQALKRFYSLEKKLNSDPQLKSEYHRVMQEYIDLGHMTLVDHEPTEGYYLPHHPVIKTSSDTTKVRVVFDASARSSNGNSLNDLLMVGPTIQKNIFDQLLKLRVHKYVVTADIEKMYRQIRVHPDDQRYQLIFWYHEEKIKVFKLTTDTFGVSSAAFLAVRTLQQLAIDGGSQFPRASKMLCEDMYVDDLVTRADSLAEIQMIRDDMIELLKLGGFNIRQWASNNKDTLNDITKQIPNSNWTVKDESILKTLGVVWDSTQDELTYNTNELDLNSQTNCWEEKLDWNESIPIHLHTKWTTFAEQLPLLQEVKLNRRILIDNYTHVELHGFCDASAHGYGACIYLLSSDESGEKQINLVCAKSKVAPAKGLTTPRLELCAATTLVKLYRAICHNFNFKINRSICWSDSMIVLQWLKKSPSVLKIFKSNRVSEIQKFDDVLEWRHVRSADNPADALSRGQLPADFLRNTLWFNGPNWLSQTEGSWPQGVDLRVDDSSGLKSGHCFLHVGESNELFSRFSFLRPLIKFTARALRWLSPKTKRAGSLEVKDLELAELEILKQLQAEYFRAEIKLLTPPDDRKPGDNKVENFIPKPTRFDSLSPFIDSDGLLRVSGRLERANIPYSQKHPILLPQNNHVTDLIIKQAHYSALHAGIQITLYTVQQKYWILNGRDQVRRIIKRCTTCIREKPRPLHAKMATLPESRVTEAFAFEHVGIYFFSPILMKEKEERNRNKVKAYGCVFVCMATKAVHIEATSDLTTAGFLAAFERFISRRGIPTQVFSDNGTNLVGANNELKELCSLVNSHDHIESVKNFALEKRITWNFIPPLSPHFGGLWEAAVKWFEHHLKRVLKDHLITYEELNTLLNQIEAILNSRPMCVLSADPNDPQALSPAHILIGRPINFLPSPNLLMIPENRLSAWRFITKARQDFWNRWYKEYLTELQKRQKWHESTTTGEPGSVAIIIDKNSPTARWPLGVVIEVFPGSDRVNRVANVKTSTGLYKRNITSLCLLPIT